MSGYICSDLMVNIFERLPPKSIIRFRSLSKYWHSRLLSPEFLHDHRIRCSKNPPKVLIRHLAYRDDDFEFKYIYTLHSRDQLPLDPESRYQCGYVDVPGVEFPYSLRSTEVVGSYNGILCLFDKEIISLWNFSIRRKLIVSHWKSYVKHALGFGFDPVAEDYKIVAISYDRYVVNGNSVFIYSLKTESWSEIPTPSTPFYNVKTKACLLNGILHWVVDGYLPTEISENVFVEYPTRFILTFDLRNHVFGHISLLKRWNISQLTTINGCLAVVYHFGDCVYWRIWEIGSWSILFDFEEPVYDVISVIQPVIDGDVVVCYDGKVYNVQKGLLTELLKFGPDCFILEMEAYVESLELLDKGRATTCGETIFSWTEKDNYKRARYRRY